MDRRRRNRIVVTPAGRRRYLELLSRHLLAQRADFDEWHLWLNTAVQDDVDFIQRLASRHPDWVRVVRLAPHLVVPQEVGKNQNIHRFFDDARDSASAYLRLDDDMVYLAGGCIRTLFEYRESHAQPFLVYGNIVNNAITSHLFQRNDLVRYPRPVRYDCLDVTGWSDIGFALALHHAFLEDAEAKTTTTTTTSGPSFDRWRRCFSRWCLWDFERVSINCVAWLGEDMDAALRLDERAPRARVDEEQWLASICPSMMRRPNVILGDAPPCVHFAFGPQRAPRLRRDDESDDGDAHLLLLERYRALAPAS